MPTTLPGISVTEAQRLLQVQDRILKQLPRGRARVRQGGPRRDVDRPGAVLDDGDGHRAEAARRVAAQSTRWYSAWAPAWLKPVLRRVTRDRISTEELVDEMDDALQLPGSTNAWTMPIKARIDMLTTGIRTPVGIKIYGADLDEIERIGTADRGGAADGRRHAQRVRRARRRRLLPRLRLEARGAGALRPDDRRRADGRDVRGRRRERDHHGRGPRALPGQRALLRDYRSDIDAAAAACSCRRWTGGADPDRRSSPTSSWSAARR